MSTKGPSESVEKAVRKLEEKLTADNKARFHMYYHVFASEYQNAVFEAAKELANLTKDFEFTSMYEVKEIYKELQDFKERHNIQSPQSYVQLLCL